MHHSNRAFIGLGKRLRSRLAIGQILREDFRYEVHGPFVAATPEQPSRSFRRRLSERLSDLAGGLAGWSRQRSRTAL